MDFNFPYIWAYKAREKLYDKLNLKEIKHLLSSSGGNSTVISVFGKSQVGKTTLIMKLIGISDESFSIVANTLRGGRPLGAPCSPTAIIYKKTDDVLYHYKEPDGKEHKYDDKNMCYVLKELRNRVENKSFNKLDEVIISIPSKYFTKQGNSRLKITIIDLPGYGSSVVEEKEYTERLYRKYLPLSGLRLLVENVNNIESLNEINDNNRVSVDWRYQPSVYRIILTRSASANSIKKEILALNEVDKNAYKNIFNKSLKNAGAPDGVKYYPLEYGDSWDKQKLSNSKLYSLCNPIIDELLSDLRIDIEKSSNPAYQILSFFDSQKVIERIKTDKLKTHNLLKSDLNGKRDVAIKEQSSIDNTISNLNTRIENLQSKIINNLDFKNNDINDFFIDTDKYFKQNQLEDQKSVSYLHNYLNAFNLKLNNKVRKFVSYLEENYNLDISIIQQKGKKIKLVSEVSEIICDEQKSFLTSLNRYIKDKYHPFWTDNWKNDKKTCRKCIKETVEQVSKLLKKCTNSATIIFNEKINSKLKKDIEELKLLNVQKINNNLEIESINSQIFKIDAELSDHLENIKEDEKITSEFMNSLTEGFIEEFNDTIKNMNRNIKQEENIFNFLYLNKINNEFYKLLYTKL